MSYRNTLEFRSAISAGMKRAHARGQYRNAKRSRVEKIEWKCAYCSKNHSTIPSKVRKYCDTECARWDSRGRIRNTPSHRHGKEIREKYSDSILRLYRSGNGHKTIAKRLNISPRIVHTILIERGEWKPNPERNGVALKGRAVIRKKQRALKRVLIRMQSRTRKCLDKKPPRPRQPTNGMTAAEAFRYRYKNDIPFRIYQLLRRRMKKVIKEGVKHGSSLELVGCTTQELKEHLSRHFVQGMSWKNMGTGRGKWHIHHCISAASFRKVIHLPEQQRILFHWSNLRPMWSRRNMSLGARLDRHRTLPLPLPNASVGSLK